MHDCTRPFKCLQVGQINQEAGPGTSTLRNINRPEFSTFYPRDDFLWCDPIALCKLGRSDFFAFRGHAPIAQFLVENRLRPFLLLG